VARFSLTVIQRRALRTAFEERPTIIRASLVPRREQPVLAIELAERPESDEAASAQVHEIVAAAAEAIGDAARDLACSMGAAEHGRVVSLSGIPIYTCAPEM